MIYLNIGKKTDKKDWVNIKEELAKKLKLNYADNTVDIIVCIHFLEHFTYKNASLLLKEIYRILKPKGILRIGIPDLDIFLTRYLMKDNSFYGMREGKLFPGNTLTDRFIGTFFHKGHKYFYNFESISYKLREIGFNNIEKVKYNKTKHDKKIIELDIRPLETLYIEVDK